MFFVSPLFRHTYEAATSGCDADVRDTGRRPRVVVEGIHLLMPTSRLEELRKQILQSNPAHFLHSPSPCSRSIL